MTISDDELVESKNITIDYKKGEEIDPDLQEDGEEMGQGTEWGIDFTHKVLYS